MASAAGIFHNLARIENARVVPGAYIVEYTDQPHIHPRNNGPQASGISDLMGLHSALEKRQVQYSVRTEYGIFNGAAIHVTSDHGGEDLAGIPGIKNVWPVRLISSPKPLVSTLDLKDPVSASMHAMTGVDVLHKSYNLTGKGVKVGVIDTGIDYKHPAFANPGQSIGCFGPGCRVAYGHDFVGNDYDGSTKPKPSEDPMDCQGHGTHVAGIIGADALNIPATSKLQPPQPFVGVAPEVTLGAYRVFGCEGSVGEDIILEAMERAFKDGMDIINMSLGGGSAYKTNAQAVLADKLAAQGLIVAVAAGNDGEDGVWMVSDACLGDYTTAVASFDNIYGSYFSFSYGGVAYPYGVSEAYGEAFINIPGNVTLFPLLDKNGALSDGCDPSAYTGQNVTGKVVLVAGIMDRCRSDTRGENAIKATAAGMLVQMIPFGIGALSGVEGLPMGSIENKAGNELLEAYKKNPGDPLVWITKEDSFLIEGGGAPSEFSSYGLDGDLRSKPDIGAPGGNILSTYPTNQTGYAVLSGTSMATPYIAGANALYLQHKNSSMIRTRVEEIRRAFKNTAKISQNFGSTTFASVAKQGAGLLNVLNAIKATVAITPDHIDLLDSPRLREKLNGTVQLTLQAMGNVSESYTFSHIPADALNSYPTKNTTFPLPIPLIEADSANVVFSPSTVEVPSGGSVTVNVTFQEPTSGSADQFPLYSGYIVATPASKDGVTIQVPYTGIKGDVSMMPIMDTSRGFPNIRSYNNVKDTLSKVKGAMKFDMNTTFPVFQARWGSHTPSAEIRIYDAQSNSTLLGFMNSRNMGVVAGPMGRIKNADDDGGMAMGQWLWDGEVLAPSANATAKPVRLTSGAYKVVVAYQRKFTKGDYPADYETFDMGTITF
ncbi:MAG: peptidase S8/S53 domain-containing protein [Benniella sp.]|nr:MAG: peptidase S8/S53 domain-containing protein [Benniella sp.]